VAPGETGADGRTRTDRARANRVRHGVARAIEARNDRAVRPQHLGALIGARTALGAHRRAVEGDGDERCAFNSPERSVAATIACVRLVALPDRLAAAEILVTAGTREAIIALDRL